MVWDNFICSQTTDDLGWGEMRPTGEGLWWQAALEGLHSVQDTRQRLNFGTHLSMRPGIEGCRPLVAAGQLVPVAWVIKSRLGNL